MRNWKKNAKLAGVSFKRLPVSAENNGNCAQTWNPGYTYLGARAQALECVPHAINGTGNHVHLILTIPPGLAVAAVIIELKSAGSRRLNKEHPEAGFAWESGYDLFTVSASGLERVVGYVKTQKQHHAAGTLIAAFEPSRE